MVCCCVYEKPKNRDSALRTITKFVWQLGRCKPSSHVSWCAPRQMDCILRFFIFTNKNCFFVSLLTDRLRKSFSTSPLTNWKIRSSSTSRRSWSVSGSSASWLLNQVHWTHLHDAAIPKDHSLGNIETLKLAKLENYGNYGHTGCI